MAFPSVVTFKLISIMRLRRSSQSSASSTNNSSDSSDTYSSGYVSGQDDYADQDVMCLVYPDGTTRNVTAQQGST